MSQTREITSSSDKQLAHDILSKMPEAVSLREIVERIALVASIREGIREADEGKLIPAEDVFRDLQTWLAR